MNQALVLSQARIAIRPDGIHLKNRVGPVSDRRAKEFILTNAALMDATRVLSPNVFPLHERTMFAGLSKRGTV